MKSPRHADTKERTEKHKNHNGGMVEVEQHIILHITLVRNLLREFVCTVVECVFCVSFCWLGALQKFHGSEMLGMFAVKRKFVV